MFFHLQTTQSASLATIVALIVQEVGLYNAKIAMSVKFTTEPSLFFKINVCATQVILMMGALYFVLNAIKHVQLALYRIKMYFVRNAIQHNNIEI